MSPTPEASQIADPPRRTRFTFTRGVVIGGLLAALVVIVVTLPPSAVPTPELPVLGDLPECPRHEGYVVDSAGTLVVRGTVAAAGAITLIPEFHDCQRLLLAEDRKEFGPLVAIYARIGLENVGDPGTTVAVQCAGGTPQGPTQFTVAATIAAGQVTRMTVVPSQPTICGTPSIQLPRSDGRELAAVTVYNFDDPYVQLDVPKGFSCVYLYHEGIGWASQIFPGESGDTDGSSCNKPLPSTGGLPLQVRVVDEGAVPPPVARWDWDGNKQFIGVRCGTKWCEVYKGAAGDTSTSPVYYAASGARILKGTYDEQYLAIESGNDLIPGPALGTILPIPWLSNDEPNVSDWKTVANSALSLDVDKYEKRFKFKKKDVGEGAEVSLCRGTKSDCLPFIWRYFGRVNSCDQVVESDGSVDSWWAKIVLGKKTTYRCVIRRKHPVGVPQPPDVVRWRWDINDEGIWRRCAAGCCEVT